MLLLLSMGLVVAQLLLPRRLAFAPLLVAICHFGNVEAVPQLTPVRMVLLVGLIRAIGGGFAGVRFNTCDRWMVVFSVVAVLSSVAHGDIGVQAALIERVGLVLNVVGTYWYGRCYLRGIEPVVLFSKVLVIVLVPLGVMLLAEWTTGRNVYSAFGARKDYSLSREGKNRAQGTFGTPILAGTVGATAIPFMFLLRQRQRQLANVGLAACLVVVVASASSGPAATALVAFGAVFMWRWRQHLRAIIFSGLGLAVFLHLIKERPVWYLMDLIDIAGGSTGWYRAKLIDASMEYFGEWWLGGTDYTRHWMPTGARWNPDHADLTNYFIYLGVMGGIGLALALAGVIWSSFSNLRRAWTKVGADTLTQQYVIWCVGAAVFCHLVNFVSVAYFDQTVAYFFVLVGIASGLPDSVEVETEVAVDVIQPEWLTSRGVDRAPSSPAGSL